MISADRLREVLTYDPETGHFTWLVATKRRAAGSRAGSTRDDGYIVIRVDGRLYRAHLLAFVFMEGKLPDQIGDHKNGVKSDNRWDNLRPATPSMNAQNTHTEGSTGVEVRPSGRVRAAIRVDGKKLTVGTFDTEDEAKAAYLEAKRTMHSGYLGR